MQNQEPVFARTKRDPVVAAGEGAVNLVQKRGLGNRRRQVPQHHLRPIQRALHATTTTKNPRREACYDTRENGQRWRRMNENLGGITSSPLLVRINRGKVCALIPQKSPKLPCALTQAKVRKSVSMCVCQRDLASGSIYGCDAAFCGSSPFHTKRIVYEYIRGGLIGRKRNHKTTWNLQGTFVVGVHLKCSSTKMNI